MIKVLITSYFIALAIFISKLDSSSSATIRDWEEPVPSIILGNNEYYHHDHNVAKRKPKSPNNATNFTISLRKEKNEFYGSVRIGSTGQEYHVVLDTSWTATWIMSKQCSPGIVEGCKGHNLYDHDRSDTYKANDTVFNIGEGENRFEGYYSNDKINYGQTKIPNELFIEMTYVPSVFNESKADGIIALGLPAGGQQTMPQLLYAMKLIKKPIYSIYLNNKPESTRGGDILVGEINSKHIHVNPQTKQKDDITYVQVDASTGKWYFKLDGVYLDYKNKSKPICDHDCKGYVDTGTYDIYAPSEQVIKINKILRPISNDDHRYGLDCTLIHQYPPLNFIIGGETFALGGKDYVQKESSGNTLTCFSSFRDYDASDWRIGSAFLARYFTVYDFEKKIIGFVMAA